MSAELVTREHRIPCPDGVQLAARSWRAAGTIPLPTLLMRQPYGRAIAGTITYAHPSWYAAHGYWVIVQDVRGQGDSDGRFGGFAQEAGDLHATLAWLRRQPLGNGRIGLYGFSYQGLTQLLARPDTPPPSCMAPAMCGPDERSHWASEGEAHWWGLGLAWALQLAALQCRRGGRNDDWWRIRTSLESGAFLREGPALLEQIDPDGMGWRWLRQNPADPSAWVRHPIPAAWLRRPLLLIGGWFDPHLRGTLDLWRRSVAAGGSPELLIGAWSHLQWDRRCGSLDLGPGAAGGVDRQQLAFFERHLRGDEASDQPAGRAFDLGSSRWRDLTRGSAGGTPPAWELAGNGLAASSTDGGLLVPRGEMSLPPAAVPAPEPPAPPVLSLVHDPWRPAPGRGGHLGLDAGPVDRADLDSRTDVMVFTASPEAAPRTLFGQPLLQLEGWSDQEGFDLCCTLSLLEADGRRSLQISSGVARFLGEDCRSPRRREVRLQPLLVTLQAGQALRLSIALAAWPQIAVNPGSGAMPWGPAGPDHRVITLSLRPAGSALILEPMPSVTLAPAD
ncbi:CocE/NonD family hydrolase [Synechococcus sp. RSCCF101]|uniref:CocE/NonD family hydrolase n=1 Tax=Synechococcus sp. RSCCF101 TaxID=2511069 RepID=UPI00124555C2|nr:CocE/NonD family hydrolase [Synechococcus sp. RSCCF101]QEY31413.1 CocE/NonD family hydrolase [Synechococcus sp. RSCCF101]